MCKECQRRKFAIRKHEENSREENLSLKIDTKISKNSESKLSCKIAIGIIVEV